MAHTREIKRMRKMVEETHWIKRAYRSCRYVKKGEPQKECFCLVGMIQKVTKTEDEVFRARDEELLYPSATDDPYLRKAKEIGTAVFEAIKELYPRTRARCIEDWNDADRTKREDVLAVLDHVLAKK